MRSACLLLILVIAINVSVNLAAEECPVENCMQASHCEEPVKGVACTNKQQTCCSVVKSRYRTACRHHGGECMKKCASTLQRAVVDCPGQVCCVLV